MTIAGVLILAASFAAPVLAVGGCGTIASVTGGPTGEPKYLITLRGGGDAATYRLSGQGTAPADLGALFSANTPQIVVIDGRELPANSDSPQAMNLSDFTVTRVASCGLPSTSTQPAAAPPPLSLIVVLATLTAIGGVLPRRRESIA